MTRTDAQVSPAIVAFRQDVRESIRKLGDNEKLRQLSLQWIIEGASDKYSYNFTWLGRPIIQYPQDIVALQEIIWETRPDVIVETGIAHGGSLILSASMLSLLDTCDGIEALPPEKTSIQPRMVIGVDVEIRPHNREALEQHPLFKRIRLVEGDSVSAEVVQQITDLIGHDQRVMVILDSNHTAAHVLSELEAYAPLVSVGCYCIVFDTIVEDLPESFFPDRPWGRGNNPKTAVREFLARMNQGERLGRDEKRLAFVQEESLVHKLLITTAPEGYLRRVDPVDRPGVESRG